jgi:hypothetical protein
MIKLITFFLFFKYQLFRRPNDFDFSDDFAISQVWKCARKEQVKQELELRKNLHSNKVKVKPPRQSHTW